jgi:hypothetical protein
MYLYRKTVKIQNLNNNNKSPYKETINLQPNYFKNLCLNPLLTNDLVFQ